jgi:glycerol-3-phosphate dehydrogenase (NAD(P)+)
LRLASGASIARILADLGHVAEGVETARAIARVAAGLGIEMPITEAVCQLLDGQLSASVAVTRLMERDPKAEF